MGTGKASKSPEVTWSFVWSTDCNVALHSCTLKTACQKSVSHQLWPQSQFCLKSQTSHSQFQSWTTYSCFGNYYFIILLKILFNLNLCHITNPIPLQARIETNIWIPGSLWNGQVWKTPETERNAEKDQEIMWFVFYPF